MSSSTITSTWASSARTSFRPIRRTGYNQPTRRAPSRRSCAHSREEAMLIVDSQIHLWQNGKMSAQHRQIPTYSAADALAEMASAGVDGAVIHPPSSLGEAVNVLAVEAVRQHPDTFCILRHFDLESPDREKIVARWRERPGMLGFRFTFNQPHQQAWWTDGSLDWVWAACEKASLPVGLRARPLLLGHRHHPHAVLVAAMRDDVHGRIAMAEGPRPRARHGRRHRRLARLEAPRLGQEAVD